MIVIIGGQQVFACKGGGCQAVSNFNQVLRKGHILTHFQPEKVKNSRPLCGRRREVVVMLSKLRVGDLLLRPGKLSNAHLRSR